MLAVLQSPFRGGVKTAQAGPSSEQKARPHYAHGRQPEAVLQLPKLPPIQRKAVDEDGAHLLASPSSLASPASSEALSTASTLLEHRTLHSYTTADPSIRLQLHSRAAAVKYSPVFCPGDTISGSVALQMSSKEFGRVRSVEVQLQGEALVVGATPHRFLSSKVTLWSRTASPISPSLTSSSLVPTEAFRDPWLTDPSRQDLDQDCETRSLSSASPTLPSTRNLSRFRSIFYSRKYGGESRQVRGPPQKSKSQPTIAPESQNWAFSIRLPEAVPRRSAARPDTRTRTLTAYERRASYVGDIGAQDALERGGVRAEVAGYGVGAQDDRHVGEEGSRLAHPATAAQRKTQGSAAGDVLADGGAGEMSLPPSFTERASAAYLEYKLVVTVKKKGALRVDDSIQAPLVIVTRTRAEPSHSVRTENGKRKAPREDPDGWKFMPEVVTRLRPHGKGKGRSEVEVGLKLALARPLSYPRNSSIPFHLKVSIPLPAPSASARAHPTRKPSLSRPRTPSGVQASTTLERERRPSVGPSFAAGFLGPSLPLPISPPQVQRAPTPPQANLDLPSLVTREAVAATVRLVRAIYVGPDAMDDSKPRNGAMSFAQAVSHPLIRDPPVGEGDAWAKEGEAWVRSFEGEIPLAGSVKPSFAFSHFVLKYAVVLYPLEVAGYAPTSPEPLWSEPVALTTHPHAGPTLAPAASAPPFPASTCPPAWATSARAAPPTARRRSRSLDTGTFVALGSSNGGDDDDDARAGWHVAVAALASSHSVQQLRLPA